MIIKYSNFLEEDLFQECLEYSKAVLRNKVNLVNHADAYKGSVDFKIYPILLHKIETTNKDLSDKISSYIKEKLSVSDHEVIPNIYYFTPGSYIAWHTDNHLHATVTNYLVEDWDINNGGLFLFKENDEIKGIPPERNLAVFQTEASPHAVSPLTPNSPFRVAIHSFILK